MGEHKHVCIDSEARSLTHSWSAEISGILSAVTQPCQASCTNCTRVTAGRGGGLVQVCLCEFVCMQQQSNRHLAPVTNFLRFHCDTFETHIVLNVCSSLFVTGCVPASAQPSVSTRHRGAVPSRTNILSWRGRQSCFHTQTQLWIFSMLQIGDHSPVCLSHSIDVNGGCSFSRLMWPRCTSPLIALPPPVRKETAFDMMIDEPGWLSVCHPNHRVQCEMHFSGAWLHLVLLMYRDFLYLH